MCNASSVYKCKQVCMGYFRNKEKCMWRKHVFELEDVTTKKVEKAIATNSINNKMATGADNIPTKRVKIVKWL